MESLMDAKYNRYLDHVGVRLALIVAGFAVWLGAGVGLLKAL
jgi:hypothetical protein